MRYFGNGNKLINYLFILAWEIKKAKSDWIYFRFNHDIIRFAKLYCMKRKPFLLLKIPLILILSGSEYIET